MYIHIKQEIPQRLRIRFACGLYVYTHTHTHTLTYTYTYTYRYIYIGRRLLQLAHFENRSSHIEPGPRPCQQSCPPDAGRAVDCYLQWSELEGGGRRERRGRRGVSRAKGAGREREVGMVNVIVTMMYKYVDRIYELPNLRG